MTFQEWFKELFTDENGSADETVIYAFLGILTFNGLAIYHVIMSADHGFDMQSYGIGFGAILAAVFGGYGFKARLERKPNGPA